MVYSGTLNTTLIGMMLGGLAATLGTIAYAGMDPSAFLYGGPFGRIGGWIESLLVPGLRYLQILPSPSRRGRPSGLTYAEVVLIGYLVVDLAGLTLIFAGGSSARRLRARMERRHTATTASSP